MKFKKSFTMIELIIVIVIMGILSNITFDILSKIYNNYIYTKEINRLNAQLDNTIEIIAKKMRSRIYNTVIVTAYPSKIGETDPDKVDFKPISDLEDGDTKYTVLEWIGKDQEAKNGMWDFSKNHIQTGWSGFIDLELATRTQNDPKEFNVTTTDSNFTIVSLIDRNITASLGYNQDPFDTNTTILIFSGVDMGGDMSPDVNSSFGWYLDEDRNRSAKTVFAIQDYKEYGDKIDLNITSITENNDTTLYARYFLSRTAYAIVMVDNNETLEDGTKFNDYNLTFYYNYQPWQGDWWKDGNSTLLAQHVTEMRFRKDANTPMIRLYMCIQSPFLELNTTRRLTLCKERPVF